MSKTYRAWAPRQSLLLPPSPLEWIPQDHLAHFILDVVDELDLSAIVGQYEREDRGYPPYHPKMRVALLLYAYSVGAPSSRKIEKRCHENIGFRVIAANAAPDHSRTSDFRRRHLDELLELFVQVLRLCQKAGRVKLGHVSLDGTKIKANASKHTAMSYERMKKEEARLREKVAALLAEAEAVDAEEDTKYGMERRGDELPAELARARGRREVIREALRRPRRRIRLGQSKSHAEINLEGSEAYQVSPGSIDPGGRASSPPQRRRRENSTRSPWKTAAARFPRPRRGSISAK